MWAQWRVCPIIRRGTLCTGPAPRPPPSAGRPWTRTEWVPSAERLWSHFLTMTIRTSWPWTSARSESQPPLPPPSTHSCTTYTLLCHIIQSLMSRVKCLRPRFSLFCSVTQHKRICSLTEVCPESWVSSPSGSSRVVFLSAVWTTPSLFSQMV